MNRFPEQPMMPLSDILRTIETQKLPIGLGKEIGLGFGTPSYFSNIPETSDHEKFLVYARRQPGTEGLFGFFQTVWKRGLGEAVYPYFGYIATGRNKGDSSESFYYFKSSDARLLFEKMESMYVGQERS
ncbi:MAG: hypothetical protein HY226_02010 [Candidatus Vogelbacteria bacterium]|nr:hypothetical protein [Candidatus Vogelbacteria bacterium]